MKQQVLHGLRDFIEEQEPAEHAAFNKNIYTHRHIPVINLVGRRLPVNVNARIFTFNSRFMCTCLQKYSLDHCMCEIYQNLMKQLLIFFNFYHLFYFLDLR